MDTSESDASPRGCDPYADFSSVIRKLVSFARAPPFIVVTSLGSQDPMVMDNVFLGEYGEFYLYSLSVSFAFMSKSVPSGTVVANVVFTKDGYPERFLGYLFFVSSGSLGVQ